MEQFDYNPPVDELLRQGEPVMPDTFPDYLELGLGPEHVPELIRMMTDPRLNGQDPDEPSNWAPLHALGALKRLGAESAVEPMLGMMNKWVDLDNEWLLEEAEEFIDRIGPPAVAAAKAFLADESNRKYAREHVVKGLADIPKHHPEVRDECVEALIRQLERYEHNAPTFNGLLIAFLLDLKVREAAPVIERAFGADAVDEIVCGDWVDARLDLGLEVSPEELAERDDARRRRRPVFFGLDPRNPGALVGRPAPPPRKANQVAAKDKNKRKQARKSRKQNRKRK